MDKKLSDKQIEAIAYLEKESERYSRMAKRLKDIGLPFPSQECERFSKTLKNAVDLQIRVLKHPEQFLYPEK
jgi:hypothetical protein